MAHFNRLLLQLKIEEWCNDYSRHDLLLSCPTASQKLQTTTRLALGSPINHPPRPKFQVNAVADARWCPLLPKISHLPLTVSAETYDRASDLRCWPISRSGWIRSTFSIRHLVSSRRCRYLLPEAGGQRFSIAAFNNRDHCEDWKQYKKAKPRPSHHPSTARAPFI